MATGGTVTFDFLGNTKDLDSKINQTTDKVHKASSTVKDVVIGMGISKVISTAMSTISNSIDGAISRVDTLNNFPKVMQSLGFSSKDAEKSISDLSDGIEGLPTTLDEIVGNTQLLTSSLGDLKKGTKSAIALNDMFLAGGQGSEAASRALTQYNQILARGKVDQQSWNTLIEVAPGQMKELAQSMLGATANQKDLYDALQEGVVSIDDMNNAIIKLDEEGGDGFSSFKDQALDTTGGIATSITNIKTAVTKGIANAIQTINKSLQESNLPTFQEMLLKAKETINVVFDNINKNIPPTIEFLKKLWKWIDKLSPVIVGVTTALVAYNVALKVQRGLQIASSIMGSVKAFMQLLPYVKSAKDAMLLLNIVTGANPFILVAVAIVGLIAGLVLLYNKCEWFRNGVNAVFDFVKTIALTVFNFVKNNWQNLLLFLVNPFAGGFKLLYDNCGAFRNFIDNFVAGIKNAISSMGNKIGQIISNIKNMFNNTVNTMKNIGLDIVKGIGNGITSGIDWIKNKIKSFVGNVTEFIKKTFKIGSPSKLMASEVGQWLPKGIAVGINANADSVTKAMDNINAELLDSSMFNISPNMVANASNTFSPNVNVNVQNNMTTDPLGQVVSNIKTFSNGAKNDYNYGM